MTPRTPIGGLMLEDVEGWAFHVQENGAVAGQRSGDDGVLRIFSISSDQLRQPVTHEECLSLAAARADVGDAAPFGRQMMQSVCGPFGSARFRRRSDDAGDHGGDQRDDEVVRVWYCTRPSGLIIGIYGCSLASSRTPSHALIGSECAHMICSAIFNRPSWGGEDELTRCLLPELEKAEREADANQPPGM